MSKVKLTYDKDTGQWLRNGEPIDISNYVYYDSARGGKYRLNADGTVSPVEQPNPVSERIQQMLQQPQHAAMYNRANTVIDEGDTRTYFDRIGDIVAETWRPVAEATQNKQDNILPIRLFNAAVGTAFSPLGAAISYLPEGVQNTLAYTDPALLPNLFNSELYTNPDWHYLENRTAEPAGEILTFITNASVPKGTKAAGKATGKAVQSGVKATKEAVDRYAEGVARRADEIKVGERAKEAYKESAKNVETSEIFDGTYHRDQQPLANGEIAPAADYRVVSDIFDKQATWGAGPLFRIDYPGTTTLETHYNPIFISLGMGRYGVVKPTPRRINLPGLRSLKRDVQPGTFTSSDGYAFSMPQFLAEQTPQFKRVYKWLGDVNSTNPFVQWLYKNYAKVDTDAKTGVKTTSGTKNAEARAAELGRKKPYDQVSETMDDVYASYPTQTPGESFSTDILMMGKEQIDKGIATAYPSVNKYIEGFNAYGNKFDDIANLFGDVKMVNGEQFVLFKDMTPENVAKFNKMFPETPIYEAVPGDAGSRRMDLPIYLKR